MERRCRIADERVRQTRRTRRARRIVQAVRTRTGAMLAETAGSFSLLCPIIMFSILSVGQFAGSYMIHTGLTQAALEAAHDLGAVWVAQNQPGQALTTAQQQAVYNSISVPNIIPLNTSSNNNPNFTTATFNFTSSPQTVSVTAMYQPFVGAYAIPMVSNLVIRASSTYPLPSRGN